MGVIAAYPIQFSMEVCKKSWHKLMRKCMVKLVCQLITNFWNYHFWHDSTTLCTIVLALMTCRRKFIPFQCCLLVKCLEPVELGNTSTPPSVKPYEFAGVDKLRCSGLGQAKEWSWVLLSSHLQQLIKGLLLHKEHFILVRTKRFCALEPTIWNLGNN
jgi:hypothetical protein